MSQGRSCWLPSEWTTPLASDYRGVTVHGLAPNSQGLSTLQLLNIAEQMAAAPRPKRR